MFRVAKAVVHVYYVELIERCWPIRYDFVSLNFSSKHVSSLFFFFVRGINESNESNV